MPPVALLEDLERAPSAYCPWMPLTLLCAARWQASAPEGLRRALAPLLEGRRSLERALDAHFPAGGWRILS
jgi:hypothetical protein